ncbi:MAG: hypothetical protein AAGC56_03660 [Pseudomonadota bacterium]
MLVLTAGLSIIAFAGFQAVSTSATLMAGLRDDFQAQTAVFSAEQETLFAFLTAQPTNRGLYTGPPLDGEAIALGVTSIAEIDASAFWRGDGASRLASQAEGDVRVVYQDGGAFLYLGFEDAAIAAALFQALGASRMDSEAFAARLGDYQDMDFTRRFRGGERSDYRIARMAPPTDSPLRAAGELTRVLGADALLTPDLLRRLERLTAYGAGYSPMKAAYLSPELGPVLERHLERDDLNTVAASDPSPSAIARFTFSAAGAETVFHRVIQYERRAFGEARPFRRTFVEERVSDDVAGFQGEVNGSIPTIPPAAVTGPPD